MSYFVLNQTYPLKVIIQSLLGFFPDANLYSDLNSPLWYITPLLVYYFLFPLIFWRRFPLFSSAVMAGIGWVVIKNIVEPYISSEVIIALYKLHFLAFPLGMAIGALVNQPPVYLATLVKRFVLKFKNLHVVAVLRLLVLVLAAYIIFYTHHHSGVGAGWKPEAITSLCTSLAILIFFLFKKINFKILSLFGIFSFEIYLLRWPLL